MTKFKKIINTIVNYVFILSLLYFILINLVMLFIDVFNISVSFKDAIYIITILLILISFIGVKFVKIRLT